MAPNQLTTKQQYWLNHVKAAEDSAGTIAEYASRHNLRLKTLYQWKSKLIKLGLYEREASQSDFLPVRIQSVEPVGNVDCTIHLTNGDRVELTGKLDSQVIGSIITSVGLRQ